MKLLSVLATSTLLSVGFATSSLAFSAAPVQKTQAQAAHSTISPDKAISIAKSKAKGVVKSVDFDKDDNEYEVELVSNNQSYEIKINANTGKVVKTEQEKLSNDDVREYAALNKAKTTLSEAMKTASSTLKGRAVEAEFDMENGQAVYEVEVIKNREKHKAYVDVNTGKIVKTERD